MMALPTGRSSGEHPHDSRQASAPSADSDWHAYYQIENPVDVDAYVADHPSVTVILNEAPDEILTIFGTTDRPRLRLACDPEVGDCWLSVGIPAADIGPSALPLIDALDERWWLDRMTTTHATVIFDVVAR
jgi:hypothetical protein